MVAIVSGNGLGLFNTSLTNLGTAWGGPAGLGQSRESQRVNIATGNLILQDQDENMLVRGLSTSFLRTYNSMGTVAGQGQDGFITGYERKVALGTGAVGAAGSTMILTTGDGQTQTFTYTSGNSSNCVYTSTAGDGAHDTLSWSSSSSTWAYVEGSSRRQEIYENHAGSMAGRLRSIIDLKSDGTAPAQFDVHFVTGSNTLVSDVTAVDGATPDQILFGYTGTQLTSITTRESGVTKYQVTYGYESGTGRLQWVQQDLTPLDAAGTWLGTAGDNGLRFRTTYTYTSPSTASDLRIATVTQSDGTVTSYTYDSSNPSRVKTVTLGDININDADGAGETVTFTYGTNTTDVTDTLGRVWTYKYDATTKQLTEVDAPAISGLRDATTYTYDASGNVTQVKTVRGSTVLSQKDYAYDAGGNATTEWTVVSGAAAMAVVRTYNASNQVLTETRYTGLDNDGSGSGSAPSGTALTTNYIYDAQNRLRFMLSPLGEVTEYTYATGGNGIGQRATARVYLGATYASTLTENALATWATTTQKASSTLAEYTYDAKGRLSQTTAYASVDASGNGSQSDVSNGITRYTYDAQGLLRMQVTLHGAGMTPTGATLATSEQIDYAYDGLGRLMSVIKHDSASATNNDSLTITTTYAYTDSGKQIVVTMDTVNTDVTRSRVLTQTFDAAHRLLTIADVGTTAGSPITRTTQNYYDDAGQLRASQDATGARHYYFYDAKGLLSGEADETGALTEYVRDGAGQIVDTIGYTARVDTSTWLVSGAVVPTDIALVRPSWSTDFNSGVPITGLNTTYVNDATGIVTLSGGRLVYTTHYNATPTGPYVSRTPTHSLSDNITYRGEVTTAATQNATYLLFSVQNLGGGSTLHRASIFFRNGQISLNTNDGGTGVNTVFGASAANTTYVVEARTKDGAVEFTVYVKGQDPSTGWTVSADADPAVWGACRLMVSGYGDANQTTGDPLYLDNLSESDLGVRHNTRTYDIAGRVATETDAAGTITTYSYDGANRLSQTTTTDAAGTAATAHSTRYFYDNDSRLVGRLDAAAYASGSSYTGSLTENTYDFAGRLIKTVRYANLTGSANWVSGTLAVLRPATNAADQTTRYFYDGRNNQVGVLSAEGYLTEFVYDEAANQRAVKAYAKQLTGLSGNETLAGLRTLALTSPPTESLRLTQRSFNGLGQLVTELNPEGTAIRYTYDEAGRLIRTDSAFGASEVRQDDRRYDVFNNLIGEISGEQVSQAVVFLGGISLNSATLTEAQLNSVYTASAANNYSAYGTTHSYDLVGRRTESIDAQGNKTWYFYDAQGRQTYLVRGVAQDNAGVTGALNSYGEVTETRYSAFGEVLDSIAYTGRITITTPGDRTSVQTAIGALLFVAANDTRRQYDYDLRGQVSRMTDAEGTVNTYTYTAFGQLDTENRALGTSAAVTIDHAYDNRGLETSRIDALGVSGVQRTVSQTYDAFGRVISAVDGRGTPTTYTYDRLGRQLTHSQTIEGVAELWQTSYDAFSRVVSQTDALGRVTTYAYSDGNRTVTVTTPELTVSTTTHNRFGQTVTVTDGNNATTTFVYDQNGALKQTIDATGGVTNYTHDVRGLLLETTDATGHKIDYAYDAVGRVLSRIEDPAGLQLTTLYAYDARGNQLTVTDPSGRVTAMTYDQEGRLLTLARDPSGLNLRTTYSYDAAGRQVTVVEAFGTAAARTTQYVYDALGRRLSETVSPGTLNLTTTYSYDADDNLIGRTDATGNLTRYAYDEANRLRFAVDALGGLSETRYDANGRVTRTRQFVTPISLATLTSTWTRAQIGALAVGDGLDVIDYRVYDQNNRLTATIDGTGGVTTYTYDAADRVITNKRYANAATLTTLTTGLLAGTTTVANVLAVTVASATDQTTTFAYDDAGRMLRKTDSAGAVTRYIYDAAGRTMNVIDALGNVTRNWYDQAGRLVATRQFAAPISTFMLSDSSTYTQVNAFMTWGTSDQGSYFVYDASGKLRYTQTMGGSLTESTYDSAGRQVSSRTYATFYYPDSATNTLLFAGTAYGHMTPALPAANNAADLRSYSIYDELGHVRATVDGAGNVTQRTYDAAGRVITETRYVTAKDISSLTASLAAGTTTVAQVTPTLNAIDQIAYSVYDAAGRLRYSINRLGQTTEQQYDAAGRLVGTRSYANAIDLTTGAGLTLKNAIVAGTATPASVTTSALVADAVRDNRTYVVFDGSGQSRFVVDALGDVTETRYDAAGHAVQALAYPTAIAFTTGQWDQLKAGTLTAATLAGLVSGQAASAHKCQYIYDAIGRLVYTLTVSDATQSVVSERRYDATGSVIAEVSYAVTIATSTAATVAGVIAALKTAGGLTSGGADIAVQQHQTRYVYDDAGHLRFTIDDIGAVSERLYDGVGRIVEQRNYQTLIPTSTAATEVAVLAALDAADLTTWSNDLNSNLTGLTATDVGLYNHSLDFTSGHLVFTPSNYASTVFPTIARSQTHAPNENVVFSGEVTTGASLTTTYLSFGVENSVTGSNYRRASILINGGTLSRSENIGGTVTNTTLGTLAVNTTYVIEAQSREGGVDYYVYVKGTDKTNGFRFSVTESSNWDAIKLRLYSYARPGTEGNPLILDNLSETVAANHHTSTSYDAAGRVLSVTDSLGNTESYTYNALGERITRKDKLGNQWTYAYDAAGRVISETSPQVKVATVNDAGAVTPSDCVIVTQTTYDALGNVTSRTEDAGQATSRLTQYTYDAVGHQITTTFPDPWTVNASGILVATNSTTSVQVTYDALGRAVMQRDVLGGYSYKVYDQSGRVAYDVDATGYVTGYGYDAYGNQTGLTRYATKLNTSGWTVGAPISEAQIETAGRIIPDAANDRVLTTTYDSRGLKSSVVQSQVSLNGTGSTAAPTTQFTYDAYGQLVKQAVLLDPTAPAASQWANTYFYYDDLGRKTMSVDAGGYVTSYAYDALGQLTSQTEYARAISLTGISTTTPPSLPAAGDECIGYDRTTTFTYDALGRKLSESMTRRFATSTGGGVQRAVVTAYSYDANDHVLSTTVDGVSTAMTYDALGRTISVTEAARDVYAGTTAAENNLTGTTLATLTSAVLYDHDVSPYTTSIYDAFGHAVQVRRYANGWKNGGAVIDTTRDQVSITRYDRQGRAVAMWQVNGTSETSLQADYRNYDAADNVTRAWHTRLGSDGTSQLVQTDVTYDAVGQQTSTITTRVIAGITYYDAQSAVTYNAFGEVTRKAATNNDLVSSDSNKWESFVYDQAGRLVQADADGGGVRHYGYNLAGAQTLEWHLSRVNGATTATQVNTTQVVDGLGRVTKLVLPSYNANTGTAATVTRRYDRWGNAIEQIDPRGFSTQYAYNDRNQVIREIKPEASVLSESGVQSWQRPVTEYYYDAVGRMVGTRDANGHLQQTVYDAAGQAVQTIDALGHVTRQAYDVFGQNTLSQDALGYLTFRGMDRLGRVSSHGDYLINAAGNGRDKTALETYVLDADGNRLSVANALTEMQRYDYDSRSLLTRSQSAMGVVKTYAYDALGRKINDADATNYQTWGYAFDGRLTAHRDLSGANYTYNYATDSEQLISQGGGHAASLTHQVDTWWQYDSSLNGSPLYSTFDTTEGAFNRTTTYYANGQVKQIDDTDPTSGNALHYLYEYDAAGNRTMEETDTVDGQGKRNHVRTRVTYDAQNRIVEVTSDDLVTPARNLDVRYDYDAVGNRRRVTSQAGFGTNALVVGPNAAPQITAPIGDHNVKINTVSSLTLSMADYFNDPEQGALSYTVTLADGISPLPGWLTATYDPSTGKMVFVSTNPATSGQTVSIKIVATDGNQPISQFFNVVTVTNTGPAVLTATVPTLVVRQNQALNFSLDASDYFTDLDVGDRLTLSLVSSTVPGLQATATAQSPDRLWLTGTPTTTGTYTVTFRATDASGASVTKTVNVQVSAIAGPVAQSLPDRTISIGRGFVIQRNLSDVFTDANGDTLQVKATLSDGTPLPSWMQLNYETTGTPPRLSLLGQVPISGVSAGQIYTVMLTATDGDGLSATTTIKFTVQTAPTSTSYTIAPFGDQTAVAGQNWTFQLPAYTSSNGDTLSYRVAHYVPGIQFNDQTLVFSGTPTTPGDYWIFIEADDGSGAGGASGAGTMFMLHVTGTETSAPPPVTTTTGWYAYDADNRVTVVNGHLQDGKILLNDPTAPLSSYGLYSPDLTSYGLAYDALGRTIASYRSPTPDGGIPMTNVCPMITQSVYNLRGQLQMSYHERPLDLIEGTSAYWGSNIAESRLYDAAGRLIETREYFGHGDNYLGMHYSNGEPLGWLHSGSTYTYDTDGRVTQQLSYNRAATWDPSTATGTLAYQSGAGVALSDPGNPLTLISTSKTFYDNARGGVVYQATYKQNAWGYNAFQSPQTGPVGFTQTFDYAYEARESYLEKTITGTSTNSLYRATTSTSTYDAYGHRVEVKEETVLADYSQTLTNLRYFSYDAQGGILSRRDGRLINGKFDQKDNDFWVHMEHNKHYAYANGQQIASYDENGSVDAVTGLTAYDQGGQDTAATVQQGDTLVSLAQRIYGNSSLWYVLASANAITSDSQLVAGTTLKVPNVTVSKNDSSTFKPYNPADIIGSTTPNLPYIGKPPETGCGTIGMIIMIIVIIIVCVYTAGAAAPAAGSAAGGGATAGGAVAGGAGAGAGAGAGLSTGLGATGGFSVGSGAGLAAATGTGASVGTGIGLTTGAGLSAGLSTTAVTAASTWSAGISVLTGGSLTAGGLGAAALGGFAGSLAGQMVGYSLGVVDHISVRQAFASGITSMLTAGIGGAFGGALNGISPVARAAVYGATSSLSSYAGNRIAGIDTTFSWRSVAASAVTSAITAGVTQGMKTDNFANSFAKNMVGGVVGLQVRRAFGFDDPVNYGQIAADAFGNAVANGIVRAGAGGTFWGSSGDSVLSNHKEGAGDGSGKDFSKGTEANAQAANSTSNFTSSPLSLGGQLIAQGYNGPIYRMPDGTIVNGDTGARGMKMSQEDFDYRLRQYDEGQADIDNLHGGVLHEEYGDFTQAQLQATADEWLLKVTGISDSTQNVKSELGIPTGGGETDKMGQPLNGPSHYDAIEQFGNIWSSVGSDSAFTTAGKVWDWLTYTVPDREQRRAAREAQEAANPWNQIDQMEGSSFGTAAWDIAHIAGASERTQQAALNTGTVLGDALMGVAGVNKVAPAYTGARVMPQVNTVWGNYQATLTGVPINGATRTVPLGFRPDEQFLTAAQQLQDTLQLSGITDATVGVRGSSVTGYSLYKGTNFGPRSDIDFFVESKQLTDKLLTDGYKTSQDIPGFIHPNKILPNYPLLQDWATDWTKLLGRKVTPGAFVPGTVPGQPSIVVKPIGPPGG